MRIFRRPNLKTPSFENLSLPLLHRFPESGFTMIFFFLQFFYRLKEHHRQLAVIHSLITTVIQPPSGPSSTAHRKKAGL